MDNKQLDIKKSIEYAFNDLKISKKGNEIKSLISIRKNNSQNRINQLRQKSAIVLSKINNVTPSDRGRFTWEQQKAATEDQRKLMNLYNDINYYLDSLIRDNLILENLNLMFEDNKSYDLTFRQFNELSSLDYDDNFSSKLIDTPVNDKC